MESIIGNDTSPIGPGDPTLPGYDDSPFSPGRKGSIHESATFSIPSLGMTKVEDSNVLAIDLFSLFRKADDGNSLLPERTGASVSALTEAIGTAVKDKSNIKIINVRSFVFIMYIFRKSVFI